MMKTITKFMTLCALFVGVNVSAQTYITSFPHSETFEEGDATAFTGGSVVSTNTNIGSVFTANTSTEVGTALFDGDTSTDGAQALTVGETDLFTISYTSYFGWLSIGKVATFSVKNSDGVELVSYGYNTSSCNLSSVKFCGNEVLESEVKIQSVYNASSGANGFVGGSKKQSYQSNEDYNTKVTITIAKSSASITFVNVFREVNLTLSAGFGEDVNVNLASINLGNEIADADRAPAIDNMTITKETAQSSIYTLKKVCSDVELSSEVVNGIVGDAIAVNNAPIFVGDKKYFYESDDSEGKTIASDGSTVVTITYREAETYSYSVKSSTGTTIAEGSNFEGESITTPYPMYVNEDGVLYQSNVENKEYNHVFTLTTNAQEEVITYNATDIADVIMYVEAENVVGMTASNGNSGTAVIRSSNAKVAYPAQDVEITTIPAGKYRIVADIYGGQKNPGELTMTIGEASHTFTSVASTYHSIQSWDVELTKEESPLMALKGGGNGVAYDFIYIIKTGNVTPISDINADKAVDNDYYDLSGRKVVNPVKGNIYINGGKLIRY